MVKQQQYSYHPQIIDVLDGETVDEFNTERLFPSEAEARAFVDYSIKHDFLLQLMAQGELQVGKIERVSEDPNASWVCKSDGTCGLEELAAERASQRVTA